MIRIAESPRWCVRAIIRQIVLLMFIVMLTGCASTKAYIADRGRDASDMFTATLSLGLGASAHAGPLATSLGDVKDAVGLNLGHLGDVFNTHEENYSAGILLLGIHQYSSHSDRSKERFGTEILFISIPGAPNLLGSRGHTASPSEFFADWTQIELAAAMGIGAHVGFNFTELLDFLVGFTTLDFMGDDLNLEKIRLAVAAKKAAESVSDTHTKKSPNNPAQATGKPAPGR